MLHATFLALLRGVRRRNSAGGSARPYRFAPALYALEPREVPAVFAFSAGGSLAVFGDNADNAVTVSRTAAGAILVNGGAVKVIGVAPTVANTTSVSLFGLGGNDALALDETNGALPRALLFGGAGNDALTGGSGSDLLFGQAGDDTLLGKGGADALFGGAGNDSLLGGTGDDQVFGEAGNDTMVWNPGEGSDLNEGGAGFDTVVNNGGDGDEVYTVVANGPRVRLDRVSTAPFSLDIGTSESLVVNLNGGNDALTAGNGLAPLIKLTVDGGEGNDTITGGDGDDLLLGGNGNDLITGGRGSDVALMGAGDDTFVWNPGDNSDVVEGQAGADTLLFNGSNVGEKIDLSANGSRLRFTRDVGNVGIDANAVEAVTFNALGGSDIITVNDLTGTGVAAVNLNLSGTPGGTAGDDQADTVIVNGSNAAEVIDVRGAGTSATVSGLPPLVNLTGTDAGDALTVRGNGGDDGIGAATLATPLQLTLDGGAGNDALVGSNAADLLIGGDGNDTITGNRGNDTALMGAGDDTFVWNPGDASDVVEGQAGSDKLLFFGSNAGENFDFSANGSRVRFTRDVGNVTIDMAGVERTEVRALGGADNVVVGDLTGTDLTAVELSLRGPNGGGDGQIDAVTVNGTQGNDAFGAAGDAGGLRVFGLHTAVTIFDQDPALDRLTLNGLGGNDALDARSLRADSVQLALNGGDGDDLFTGSDGNDLITGGRGSDVALMGAGDDTFVWNPGDNSDVVEGQAGRDELLFNGSNVGEKIDLSANGSRLRFTRDVGAVTMDTNAVEAVTFNALGGSDLITVNDLTGTGVTDVNLNLSGTIGGTAGDAQADTVIVTGTAGDDAVTVAGDGAGTRVSGLSATVSITGVEPANDRLVINALAGDDVIDASGLSIDGASLIVNGGAGDDVIIGGDGNDTITGGDGDDVLIGGPGNDLLDGGAGDNILIP